MREKPKGTEILSEKGLRMLETLNEILVRASIDSGICIVRTFNVVSAEHVTVEGKWLSPLQVGVEDKRVSSENVMLRVSPDTIAAGDENMTVYDVLAPTKKEAGWTLVMVNVLAAVMVTIASLAA